MTGPSRGPDPRAVYDARQAGETFGDAAQRIAAERREFAAPDRPTRGEVDACMGVADDGLDPVARTLAAGVRALRAELASSEFALKGWLDAAGAQSEEIERLSKELRKARAALAARPTGGEQRG